MKDYLAQAEDIEKQLGNESPEFIEAERRYYLQKSRLDLVTDFVQSTK